MARSKQQPRYCSKCGRELVRQAVGHKCRTCFNHAKRNGANFNCDSCGKTLYLPPYRACSAHHFCSRACWSKWRTSQPSQALITYQCIECGQNVQAFKSRGVHKFCSWKCHWIWRSKHERGPNSHAYIDGRTPFRTVLKSCAQFDDWRFEIFARDQWRCQECGSAKQLQVHHLKPLKQLLTEFKRAYPTLDFSDQAIALSLALTFEPFWDLSNGKTLCRDCHLKEHPNIKFFGKDTRQLDLFM